MADYNPILEMLDALQEKLDEIRDELGKLQAQASLISSEIGTHTTAADLGVIPPTAGTSRGFS